MSDSVRLINPIECEADEQRSPLGLTRSGQPVWPVFGAQPDDDDDDDDDADDGDDDDDDADSGAADRKKKSKSEDEDDDDDSDLEAERARAERYRRRMKGADRRAAEAERKLREALAGKDKDAEPSEELVKAQKENESLSEANTTLRLQNAFLLNNTYAWHDQADAMALVLKDEDVEIDDDGEVQGLKDALKRLAKAKPWMVKVEESKDDDDDDDDDEDDTDKPEARRKSTSSGRAAAGRRKPNKGADEAALVATYPALRRR
jgi:hypothetical protein